MYESSRYLKPAQIFPLKFFPRINICRSFIASPHSVCFVYTLSKFCIVHPLAAVGSPVCAVDSKPQYDISRKQVHYRRCLQRKLLRLTQPKIPSQPMCSREGNLHSSPLNPSCFLSLSLLSLCFISNKKETTAVYKGVYHL